MRFGRNYRYRHFGVYRLCRETGMKKKIDYRHFICGAITLSFLAFAVFLFKASFGRIVESFRDFGLSVAFFFTEMIGKHNVVTPTVTRLPQLGNITLPNLPETFAAFRDWCATYRKLFGCKTIFFEYLRTLLKVLSVFGKIMLFVLPIIVISTVLFQQYLRKENNDYNHDSAPLRLTKNMLKKTYYPAKNWVAAFVDFLKENNKYLILWGFIWAYNLNLITVALEFFAYYFYFAVSYNFSSLFTQFVKLAIDVYLSFRFVPWPAYVVAGGVLFDRFRKTIGYARLNHFERRNRGFINERPIVSMLCGTMGKKKTTTLADMALSQEVMFRDKAFEMILENDLKFPNFPWINLENTLKKAIRRSNVYNLATIEKFVRHLRACFEAASDGAVKKSILRHLRRKYGLTYDNLIFDYDFQTYGLEYCDDLKVQNVWEVLEIYAKLYFVYTIQSSLLISNFSVRVDNLLSDVGNFPLWNTDFFRRDARLMGAYSRHSHILDFDSLRLGKRVVENNPLANSFEFGVVLMTEIGKERGNALELSEKKKKDEEANQKNDLLNYWLKMVRHSATIDNFPFVKVLTDEQRPESWGADCRDLCEIIHIKQTGETRLAMPFFALSDLVHDWIYGKFAALYTDYRYARSDNTLPMSAFKSFAARIHNYRTRIYNRFGYSKLTVAVESGTQNGDIETKKYYLSSKKIYSKRFSTDCYSEFFTEKALRSPVGLGQLKEYMSEKATSGELDEQNSYFVMELLKSLKQSA